VQTEQFPIKPAPEPVLSTLPRTVNLMGNESHAREIKAVAGQLGDDHGISAALHVQSTMVKGLAALEDVRKTRSPSDTAAKHLARASEAYTAIMRNAAAKHDTAREQIRSRLASLDTQLAQVMSLRPSPDAAEIRQALHSMNEKDRAAAVHAGITAKGGEFLHAVFTRREVTTGLGDVQRDSFRRRAEEAFSPGLLKLRQDLGRSDKLVTGAFNDLFALEDRVSFSGEVRTELKKRTQASDDGWPALNRAIQGE
jgi:hypothetical protein